MKEKLNSKLVEDFAEKAIMLKSLQIFEMTGLVPEAKDGVVDLARSMILKSRALKYVHMGNVSVCLSVLIIDRSILVLCFYFSVIGQLRCSA